MEASPSNQLQKPKKAANSNEFAAFLLLPISPYFSP
jgi:hypothetical protein